MKSPQILPGTGRWQPKADGGGGPHGTTLAENPLHHSREGREWSPSPSR